MFLILVNHPNDIEDPCYGCMFSFELEYANPRDESGGLCSLLPIALPTQREPFQYTYDRSYYIQFLYPRLTWGYTSHYYLGYGNFSDASAPADIDFQEQRLIYRSEGRFLFQY